MSLDAHQCTQEKQIEAIARKLDDMLQALSTCQGDISALQNRVTSVEGALPQMESLGRSLEDFRTSLDECVGITRKLGGNYDILLQEHRDENQYTTALQAYHASQERVRNLTPISNDFLLDEEPTEVRDAIRRTLSHQPPDKLTDIKELKKQHWHRIDSRKRQYKIAAFLGGMAIILRTAFDIYLQAAHSWH